MIENVNVQFVYNGFLKGLLILKAKHVIRYWNIETSKSTVPSNDTSFKC
jgi:hypothetical protein